MDLEVKSGMSGLGQNAPQLEKRVGSIPITPPMDCVNLTSKLTVTPFGRSGKLISGFSFCALRCQISTHVSMPQYKCDCWIAFISQWWMVSFIDLSKTAGENVTTKAQSCSLVFIYHPVTWAKIPVVQKWAVQSLNIAVALVKSSFIKGANQLRRKWLSRFRRQNSLRLSGCDK